VIGTRCYPCRAARRKFPGLQQFESAPDKQPAEHLRDLLADDRRAGLTFEASWPDALAYVLSCIPESPDEDLASWSTVFKETRTAWAAAWLRAPVTALTVDLIDGVAEPVVQQHADLVA